MPATCSLSLSFGLILLRLVDAQLRLSCAHEPQLQSLANQARIRMRAVHRDPERLRAIHDSNHHASAESEFVANAGPQPVATTQLGSFRVARLWRSLASSECSVDSRTKKDCRDARPTREAVATRKRWMKPPRHCPQHLWSQRRVLFRRGCVMRLPVPASSLRGSAVGLS